MLVMEYLPLGNLRAASKTAPICVEEILALLTQSLDALAYAKVAHRDIKPDNILIQSRNPFTIKLADFGLAKMADEGSVQCRTYLGTELYMAPEIRPDRKIPYVEPPKPMQSTQTLARSASFTCYSMSETMATASWGIVCVHGRAFISRNSQALCSTTISLTFRRSRLTLYAINIDTLARSMSGL